MPKAWIAGAATKSKPTAMTIPTNQASALVTENVDGRGSSPAVLVVDMRSRYQARRFTARSSAVVRALHGVWLDCCEFVIRELREREGANRVLQLSNGACADDRRRGAPAPKHPLHGELRE